MNNIKILNKNKCTGCSACYNICPHQAIFMCEDSEGFMYPEVNERLCVDCGICKNICPVINSEFRAMNTFPLAYLARSKDSNIRLNSAAGGAFTSIARVFIKKYHGVVFGAKFDDSFVVRHGYTESLEEICLFSKSKYVQSVIGETYQEVKKFLENDRYVLFSGTPCQIYGLRSYLKIDYDKLCCIDVVCHGVPSPKVFRKYVSWHENRGGNIKKIIIRDKKLYKKYYRSGFGVEYENGEHYFRPSDCDLMGKFFWGEISSRPSCYNCQFKTIYRVSDLTIGDCWFSKDLAKVNDPDGITLVLVQSEKGRKLLFSSDDLEKFKVDSEKAIKANGGMLYKSVKAHPEREYFFEELDQLNIEELSKKYIHNNKSFLTSVMSNVKDRGLIPQRLIEKKEHNSFEARMRSVIPDSAKGLVDFRSKKGS